MIWIVKTRIQHTIQSTTPQRPSSMNCTKSRIPSRHTADNQQGAQALFTHLLTARAATKPGQSLRWERSGLKGCRYITVLFAWCSITCGTHHGGCAQAVPLSNESRPPKLHEQASLEIDTTQDLSQLCRPPTRADHRSLVNHGSKQSQLLRLFARTKS